MSIKETAYPHTDKPEISFRTHSIAAKALECPAVFYIVEQMRARGRIGMVVRQWNGDIQALEILEHVPSVNDLADLLAHAMQSPLSDEGHGRAEGIHLRDNPEWEELFPHLRQLKIEVVLTEALTKWDEAVAELIQYLQAQWSSRAGRQSVIKAELGYEDAMLDLKITAILFPCHRRARRRAGGAEQADKS